MAELDTSRELSSLAQEISENTVELRVSKKTSSRSLATAILRHFDDGRRVVLSCIGASSLSQGIKSVAIAMGETCPQGDILCVVPAFDIKRLEDRDSGEDIDMTAIKCLVYKLPITV